MEPFARTLRADRLQGRRELILAPVLSPVLLLLEVVAFAGEESLLRPLGLLYGALFEKKSNASTRVRPHACSALVPVIPIDASDTKPYSGSFGSRSCSAGHQHSTGCRSGEWCFNGFEWMESFLVFQFSFRV